MYTTVIARNEKYQDLTNLVMLSRPVSQTSYSRSIPYSSKADTINGVTVLIDPTTETFTNASGLDKLKGMYIDLDGAIYYLPTDATFSQVNIGNGSIVTSYTIQATKARRMHTIGFRVAPGAGPGNRLRKCDIHGLANDADDLMLGSVCASWIEATIHSTEGDFTVYNGDELTVYKVAPDGTETQVGVVNVTDARWISKRIYKITAYDNVIKLDRDITGWLRSLTGWPYALTEFYGMLAVECGLESGYSTWSGASSFMVHKFDVEDGTTGRQLMGTICELMGDYCIARADGVLSAAWYNSGYIKIHHSASQVSSGSTLDIHRFQNSLEYGDHDVEDVKFIQFREKRSDDAALWPDYGADADVSNAYIITGNPIVLAHPTYLTTTTGNDSVRGAFEKIATRFDFQRYRAFKVTIPEFLPAQVGKYVFMGDENDKIMFYAPITSMTWKGNKMVLECGARQIRTTADSPENWSNTQIVQYVNDSVNNSGDSNSGSGGGTYVNDVKTYGAKGDGSTDDTEAFQTALSKNRVVHVSGGTYVLSDTIVIAPNCCLELSQDAVLKFTQTDKNCISMLRLSSLRGNHATIFVPYKFTANAINCDGGDDYSALDPDNINADNAVAVPPFVKWDPQWKMSRYITDINVCKVNGSGFHYSDSGDCYGTAIFVHNNIDDYPVSYMWGVSMSGVRIAGGFNYGIRLYNVGEHVKCWNHDARIEAVIDACKIGVSVENAYYNRLSVTVQARAANDGSTYAEHGIQLINSPGTDLSSSRVWDWNESKSLWEPGNEYQHIALYGVCDGLLLDDFMYYAQSAYDIRSLIYTDTPANLGKMTILQEPITRWFKPVDGVPHFSDGGIDKKLITQEDIDVYFDTDVVRGFTDVLQTATDTDGSVFNEKGYDNGYIASNGGYVPSSYYVCTGFFPCEPGSEIHIANMNFKGGDDNCRLVVYDTAKQYVAHVNRGLLLANTNSLFGYRETDNGCVITVKSVVATRGTAFARFSVYHSNVGENPMVAIDEEIKYTVEGFLADGVHVKGTSVVLQSPGGKTFRLSVSDSGEILAEATA